CGNGQTECLTQLVTQVNIELKAPGNKVSLPIDQVTTNVDPKNPDINPTVLLGQSVAPQFGGVDVNQLAVFANDFALTASLKLASGDTIDPSTEEVFLRVGDFSKTILPRSFKRLLQGKLFSLDRKSVV